VYVNTYSVAFVKHPLGCKIDDMRPADTILRPMPIDPQKVIAARKKLHLSQVEFAKIAGMPQQALSRIESGDRCNPQVATAEAIARAAGVRIDDLLSGDKAKKSKRGGKR
jgi:DNA-binding XRE family transcriptional regulator